MQPREGAMEIRSYRVCFRLERRIHRLDRWRIPLPYGLPVRGLLYGLAILAAVLVAEQLPGFSQLLGGLHPILRYVALPIGGGYFLTELKLDGRTGHTAARSWLRMRLEPRRISAFRPAPPPGRVRLGSIAVAADGRGARLRRGVIEGPGRVVMRCPVELHPSGRTLRVRPESAELLRRGKRINLGPGQRVVIG